MKTVSETEAREIFRRAMKGEHFVHVIYNREMPKCEICGKRYKKEQVPTSGKCCDKELSFVTDDTCRFGVQNPGAGITKPGEGEKVGISASEAFADGNIKYYSVMREGDRTDGKRGGYRQFKLCNLVQATVEGEKYLVNHKGV